ncbi:response regulator transcription factor [Mucilaginibacter phyllosphaerae]
MFENILIAEDHQRLNHSVQQTTRELGINDPQYAYYCDDALLRIKHALREGKPFELLITDLSFDEDGREQTITSGTALIEAAKSLQPDLKVLVFSAEANPVFVDALYKRLGINGYVRKSRTDALDLKEAIISIAGNKRYIPLEFQQVVRNKNTFDFTETDIMILSLLVQGTLQKNIPDHLKVQGARASSQSSVEKRLNQIRTALGFTKNEQLIAYCKDYKLI